MQNSFIIKNYFTKQGLIIVDWSILIFQFFLFVDQVVTVVHLTSSLPMKSHRRERLKASTVISLYVSAWHFQ